MTAVPDRASPSDRGGFALFLAVAALAASLLAATVALRPPAPLGKDAPPGEFSSARAAEFLATIAGDGKPHPIGSAENVAVRERIAASFRELGLAVEIETRWVVSRGRVAEVSNVVAHLAGPPGTGPGIAVVSHHDSVPAGPGAADDLMSVAASLEVARALRESPPLENGVTFVVTDGEEAGLLGARAHAIFGPRDAPKPVYDGVVNLDARGNTGPSLLFETGHRDAAAVAAWASRAPRPVSSSLFPAVYRSSLVRNNTDFTVFREAGISGLNFACIGRIQHYHTALDTVANVDRGTLQHHGDNALAAVRGLAAAEPGGGDAAWCDVLGLFVVRWPLRATPFLAVGALAALLVALVLRRRHGDIAFRDVLKGLAAQVAALALGVTGTVNATTRLRDWGSVPGEFVAEPAWAAAAIAGLALAASWAGLAIAARWVTPAAAHAATWIVWAILGVVASLELPGGAYVFVLPACVAAVATAVRARPLASIVPTAVAAILGAPLWILFHEALGVGAIGGPVGGVLATVVGTTAGAFVVVQSKRRWLAPVGAAAVCIAGFVGAAFAPVSTEDLPRRLDFIRVVEEGDRHAHVFADPFLDDVPESLRTAFEFEAGPGRVVPWEDDFAPALEATPVTLAAPALEDLRTTEDGNSRRTRFRLVSRRGAAWTVLAIRPGAPLVSVTVAGHIVPAEGLRDEDSGAYVLECATTPAEGLAVEVEFATRDPVDVFVADETPGLLPEDAAILAARPRDRVPSGRGDRTVAIRKTRL